MPTKRDLLKYGPEEDEIFSRMAEQIRLFKTFQNSISTDINELFNTFSEVFTPDVKVRVLETISESLEMLIQNTAHYGNIFNKLVDEYRQIKASRIETAST